MPDVDVKIFDGVSLSHTLDPHKSNAEVKTFDEYASRVFHPYLVRQFELVDMIDVVWDVYKVDSLKAGLRTNKQK